MTIEKRDGSEVTVSAKRLSKADQTFLDALEANDSKPPADGKTGPVRD